MATDSKITEALETTVTMNASSIQAEYNGAWIPNNSEDLKWEKQCGAVMCVLQIGCMVLAKFCQQIKGYCVLFQHLIRVWYGHSTVVRYGLLITTKGLN